MAAVKYLFSVCLLDSSLSLGRSFSFGVTRVVSAAHEVCDVPKRQFNKVQSSGFFTILRCNTFAALNQRLAQLGAMSFISAVEVYYSYFDSIGVLRIRIPKRRLFSAMLYRVLYLSPIQSNPIQSNPIVRHLVDPSVYTASYG